MLDITPADLWKVIEGLRKSGDRPLIHCIMNYVAAADCANAVLAVGAKPVMADSPEECAVITARADALVLNMGTFSEERGRAMLLSGRTANNAGIPVILDPVGLSASGFRREWFVRITEEVRVSAVKGNLSEISAAADADPFSCTEDIARKAAAKLGCPVLVTGENDFLSDGKRLLRFENGTPHLAAVTGTGCMTGALVGAFAAVTSSAAQACAAAVSLMDICGETAAEDFRGTGTLRIGLMDSLSQITREQYLGRIRITEL